MTVTKIDLYELFKPRLEGEFRRRHPSLYGSSTKTVEIGKYKRTTERRGKKRKQKTEKVKKNDKKVTLRRIRDLELYVLPYEFPSKVFIGKYPNFSMALDRYEVSALMSFYNKAKWFLANEWQKKVLWTKQAKKDSALCKRAFNIGLNEQKELGE